MNNHLHLVAETPRTNLVDASTERRGDKSADRSVSENENYNDNNSGGQHVEMCFDFTDDLIEMEQPEVYPGLSA